MGKAIPQTHVPIGSPGPAGRVVDASSEGPPARLGQIGLVVTEGAAGLKVRPMATRTSRDHGGRIGDKASKPTNRCGLPVDSPETPR